MAGVAPIQELTKHGMVIAGLVLATALLVLRPQWVVGLGMRCEMETIFGLRCPFCGMTRDFVSILHGHQATLNPCTWMVAIFVYIMYPLLILWGWLTRRLCVFHGSAMYRSVACALVAMTLLNNISN